MPVIIQVFTHPTAQVSRSSIPTMPFALPLYEKMKDHITNATKHTTTHIRICQGAKSALGKLNKYKEKADGNQYYRLGTSMYSFNPIFSILMTSF